MTAVNGLECTSKYSATTLQHWKQADRTRPCDLRTAYNISALHARNINYTLGHSLSKHPTLLGHRLSCCCESVNTALAVDLLHCSLTSRHIRHLGQIVLGHWHGLWKPSGESQSMSAHRRRSPAVDMLCSGACHQTEQKAACFGVHDLTVSTGVCLMNTETKAQGCSLSRLSCLSNNGCVACFPSVSCCCIMCYCPMQHKV